MAGLDIKIHEQLKKNGSYLKCIKANTGGDGAGGTSNPTVSDSSQGNIANLADLTLGTYNEALNMRAVEVQSSGGGTGELLEVAITKADGSNLLFQVFHGSAWGYEGLLTEAPITDVVVVNNGATAIDVIVNVVSRS